VAQIALCVPGMFLPKVHIHGAEREDDGRCELQQRQWDVSSIWNYIWTTATHTFLAAAFLPPWLQRFLTERSLVHGQAACAKLPASIAHPLLEIAAVQHESVPTFLFWYSVPRSPATATVLGCCRCIRCNRRFVQDRAPGSQLPKP
jgi:hypothetical protein